MPPISVRAIEEPPDLDTGATRASHTFSAHAPCAPDAADGGVAGKRGARQGELGTQGVEHPAPQPRTPLTPGLAGGARRGSPGPAHLIRGLVASAPLAP